MHTFPRSLPPPPLPDPGDSLAVRPRTRPRRYPQLLAAAGGGRCRACVDASELEGEEQQQREEKWPRGAPAPLRAVAHISDPPRPRRELRDARSAESCSAALGDASERRTDARTAVAPRPPLLFACAVKCNGGPCGVKTALRHKQRRSETRTDARGPRGEEWGTGAASDRGR